MKCLSCGPYPRYELLSITTSSFDDLTAMNIKYLESDVYDQPMEVEAAQPDTKDKKTLYWASGVSAADHWTLP
jgi:hypothetical protein